MQTGLQELQEQIIKRRRIHTSGYEPKTQKEHEKGKTLKAETRGVSSAFLTFFAVNLKKKQVS